MDFVDLQRLRQQRKGSPRLYEITDLKEYLDKKALQDNDVEVHFGLRNRWWYSGIRCGAEVVREALRVYGVSWVFLQTEGYLKEKVLVEEKVIEPIGC